MTLEQLLKVINDSTQIQLNIPFTDIYIERKTKFDLELNGELNPYLNYKVLFVVPKLNLMNNAYLMVYIEENKL